jgi:hypothetical protein
MPIATSVHKICGSHFVISPIAGRFYHWLLDFVAAPGDSPRCAGHCLIFIQLHKDRTKEATRTAMTGLTILQK